MDVLRNLKIAYQKNPKYFFAGFIIFYFGILVLLIFFSNTGDMSMTLHQSWLKIFGPLSLVWIIFSKKDWTLWLLGSLYVVVSFIVLVIPFVSKAYAPVFFMLGLWFIGDYVNFRIHKRSIIHDLRSGNYYIVLGIFLSSILLGAVIEILNGSIQLWWYNFPFSTVYVSSIPLFTVFFGWFPALLGLFSIIYHCALEKNRKYKPKLIKTVKNQYTKRPRTLVSFLFLFWLLVIFIQSYFADPRNLLILLKDSWEVILFTGIFIFIASKKKTKYLFFFGAFYIILGAYISYFNFGNFIKTEYAMLFYLVGIWLLSDYYFYRKWKRSLSTDIFRGNYKLLLGLILASVVMGLIVEFINAPGQLWMYKIPIPSWTWHGIPIILATVGWIPWVGAIFSLFYPFLFRTPEPLSKVIKK